MIFEMAWSYLKNIEKGKLLRSLQKLNLRETKKGETALVVEYLAKVRGQILDDWEKREGSAG